MKVNFHKYLHTNHALKVMVMSSIDGLPEEEVKAFYATMKPDSEYNKNGTLEIELRINGVDMNIENFCHTLDKHVTAQEQQFEKWKAQYVSKNSDAAKKEKLIKQLYKTNQLLKDINEKL